MYSARPAAAAKQLKDVGRTDVTAAAMSWADWQKKGRSSVEDKSK